MMRQKSYENELFWKYGKKETSSNKFCICFECLIQLSKYRLVSFLELTAMVELMKKLGESAKQWKWKFQFFLAFISWGCWMLNLLWTRTSESTARWMVKVLHSKMVNSHFNSQLCSLLLSSENIVAMVTKQ